MEIYSESEWQSTNSGRRAWGITLNEVDGAELNPEWGNLGWEERKTWLRKRADLEVLLYMHREGAISKEYLMDRAKAIKDST